MRREFDFGDVIDRIEEPQANESLFVLDLLTEFANVETQRARCDYRLTRAQRADLLE